MAAAKQTPRQKMIGMLYLILTALLALNVSAEILDSFVLINDSLENTNQNIESKNRMTYAQFSQQLALAPERVRPFYDKATQAKEYSDEMVAYIEDLRAEMIELVEGIDIEEARNLQLADMRRKDNRDIPTNFFDPENPNGRAAQLREKLEEYKENLLSLLQEHQRDIDLGIHTDHYESVHGQVRWEMHNFHFVVAAASATNLTRMITEVRNAESDVANLLYASISADDFTFDEIAAKVVPRSQVVMVGDNFEAEIFVAAYDTRDNPEIIVGEDVDSLTYEVSGQRIEVEARDGVGYLSIPATAEGARTYGGVIKVTAPSGEVNSYPFRGEYFVQRPSATVAPTKMNVFYIGVDNPVSVSVPGVTPSQMSVSMTGGTIRAQAGRDETGAWTHIVRPDANAREAVVRVGANIAGTTRPMGQASFRIRRVPDPVAYIANTREGNASAAALVAAGGIIPRLENFEFDMNFTISSFTFLMTVPGGDIQEARSNTNRLTPEMTQMLQRARRGQRVWFENITARGPDGSTRQLAPIALRIQ